MSFKRAEILNEIKQYLQLYLFKGNVKYTEIGISNLFNLTKQEYQTLKIAHFFLSEEFKEFIEILPLLTRNLAHSTTKNQIESKGIVKGHINWNQTLKVKYENPGVFICNSPLKSYDLCENQLLKFLILKIIHLHTLINFKGDAGWQEEIENRFYILQKTARNSYFQDITTPLNINQKTINKCKNHRNQAYKKVAKLYNSYEELFIYENMEVLKDLVNKQLLKPATDETLYELYVFFNLVNCLKDDVQLGLLVEGNDYSAKSGDIKIYYQNLPEAFKQDSKYKNILENYDITSQLRRPDIIIEIGSEYRIVEVKLTEDDSYLRNSVYKVLAYFKDFQNVSYRKKIPGVLVNWQGSSIANEKNAFEQDILILNRENFLENKSLLIKE